jgi:hypothetical protein
MITYRLLQCFLLHPLKIRTDPDVIEEVDALNDFFADYVKPGDDASEPLSDLIYPLIDKLDAIDVSDEYYPGETRAGK